MTIVSGLTADGRALAEQLMDDTGTITRPSTVRTLDEVTGDSTPAAPALVHSGPCRVRTPAAVEQLAVFGDIQTTTLRRVVNFPATIPAVKVGDVVRVTSATDPQLADRAMRVVSVVQQTALMYRKIGVEVIQ